VLAAAAFCLNEEPSPSRVVALISRVIVLRTTLSDSDWLHT
jgi:hypothetical protein